MKVFAPCGLGLFLVALCCHESLAQQNPNGQLPIGTFSQPYLFLIRDSVVHAELGLTRKQQAELQSLNDALDRMIWPMRNQSAEKIDEISLQARRKAEQELSSILNDQQLQRLDQIELWMLGMRAFLKPEVARRLVLTEDQQTRIRDVFAEGEVWMKQLREEAKQSDDLEKIQARALQYRIKEQKKVLAVLTNRQQQKWKASLGARIDVKKLGYVKFRAPDFIGRQWINSPPLTLKQLHGKVVALHFYTFG